MEFTDRRTPKPSGRTPSRTGHETLARAPRGRTNEQALITTPKPTRGTSDPGLTPGNLLALQRSAGNAAVSSRLCPHCPAAGGRVQAEHLHVQRDPVPLGRDPRLERLEDLRNVLHNTLNLHAAAYQGRVESARTIYGHVLGQISRNYETAWSRHQRLLTQARADAEDENMVRGVLIGATASVAIAAAASAIPTIAALEVFSGGWWASTGAQAVGSSVAGTGIALHLTAPTNFRPGIPTELGELQQLRSLLSFERSASRAHQGAANMGRKLSHISTIIDELSGGPGDEAASRTADDFLRQAPGIGSAPDAYLAAWQQMGSFVATLEGWEAPSPDLLERAIWVHWIASLSMADHDLLDRDVIEDYLHGRVGVLGAGGILGVDTREVFDTDKEEEAIRAARRESPRLQAAMAAPSPPR